jgi:hypothetical protein
VLQSDVFSKKGVAIKLLGQIMNDSSVPLYIVLFEKHAEVKS